MEIIANLMSWLIVIFILSIPITWVWVFYHKIKCRNAQSCANRKCKFWGLCIHNYAERKKDEIELRRKMLLYGLGLPEEDSGEK